MQRLFRIGAAALSWFVLGLQYYLIVRYQTDGALGEAAIRFFSFFTILCNILVALAMTLPWLAPNSALGSFSLRPSVRTAIATYIIIVAVIYHYILRQLWNPQGWQLFADTVEHDVAPILYLIDWLVFVPKGTLKFKSAFVWLAFPIAYAAYLLIYGALSGSYPYPFVDVTTLGLDRVLINMGVLIVVFTGLGLMLVGADHALGRWRAQRAA